jgi:hypothetical protein
MHDTRSHCSLCHRDLQRRSSKTPVSEPTLCYWCEQRTAVLRRRVA